MNMVLVTFFAGMLAGIPATLLGLRCIHAVSRNVKTKKAAKSPYNDINLLDTKFKKCG